VVSFLSGRTVSNTDVLRELIYVNVDRFFQILREHMGIRSTESVLNRVVTSGEFVILDNSRVFQRVVPAEKYKKQDK